MKIRTNSDKPVDADRFRNFRERVHVFWRTGYRFPVIGFSEDPNFHGRFVTRRGHAAQILISDEVPTEERHQVLVHECMHANSIVLRRGKGWPDAVYSEAVSLYAQMGYSEKYISAYSDEDWPEEALIILATEWHLNRRAFDCVKVSIRLRLVLMRLTIPLSGIAHNLLALLLIGGAAYLI